MTNNNDGITLAEVAEKSRSLVAGALAQAGGHRDRLVPVAPGCIEVYGSREDAELAVARAARQHKAEKRRRGRGR